MIDSIINEYFRNTVTIDVDGQTLVYQVYASTYRSPFSRGSRFRSRQPEMIEEKLSDRQELVA